MEGARQERRVPWRSGVLHPASARQALAGRRVRHPAHPVLRLRLQRPAGIQHDVGAGILHPRLRHQRHRHRHGHRAGGHDRIRHFRRRAAYQRHHVHHRAGHGDRLYRAGAVDHVHEPGRDSGRVLPHLRVRIRLPVHLRWVRRVGGHAGHQARPVLERGRHGFGSQRRRRACPCTSTRWSSARARP